MSTIKFKSLILIFSAIWILVLSSDETNESTLTQTSLVNVSTMKNVDTRHSLAYGSLLNAECETQDDCILKNSICNIYTKRCECDFNAIESNNRCQTLRCITNQDCTAHFDNTICVFGSCRCKLGLKANGKCVDIDVPILGGKSMPDWGISLIAVVALLSGIWGGRSQFMGQLVRQLLSVMVLILGQFANRNRQQQQQQQQSQIPMPPSPPPVPPLPPMMPPSGSPFLDELQSAMAIANNPVLSTEEKKRRLSSNTTTGTIDQLNELNKILSQNQQKPLP